MADLYSGWMSLFIAITAFYREVAISVHLASGFLTLPFPIAYSHLS